MAERPVACVEWQEDLAGWLMAQLPPDREALFVGHLESCPTCRAEAGSLLDVTAVSLAVDPDPVVDGADDPPADLGERIVATISAERRTRRRVRSGLVALAGAAAAVVAIALLQQDTPSPLRGEELVFTVVPSGAAVEGVVAPDADGSLVELVATGLDPQITYALWLSPPEGTWDDRIAAGTFRPEADGEVRVRLRCALPVDEYGRAWATTPDGKVALDTK
jgi:hypothetical protein